MDEPHFSLLNSKNAPHESAEALLEKTGKVRYAVVGLGYIAQTAVLPAFANAKENSELVALVSSDMSKMKKISDEYGQVPFISTYDHLEDCIQTAKINAVYLAVPNALHHPFAMRALKAGAHVLCEKPLALTPQECKQMIDTAHKRKLKLMTAYRLHFEAANLEALQIARSGKLGELRIFNSAFTVQVTDKNNIRLNYEMGGGPIYDMGIYAINAARTLFDAEPMEVTALSHRPKHDARFREVDEVITVILKFPRDRIATFVASFGAFPGSSYELTGTNGRLKLEPAYDFDSELVLTSTTHEHASLKTFRKRDQFAPELLYFSDCILHNHEIEPSGLEGLADVQIIDAIMASLRTNQTIIVNPIHPPLRPHPDQMRLRPANGKSAPLFNANPPS